VVAFQPHRYSRTAALLNDFGPALAAADEVVLTDIYPAGEAPVPGATLDALAAAAGRVLGHKLHVAATLDAAFASVLTLAQPGDAVITLGAGSISSLGPRLLAALERGNEGRPLP
jgi:UDP-N-acetylmuramate--alanine ligase